MPDKVRLLLSWLFNKSWFWHGCIYMYMYHCDAAGIIIYITKITADVKFDKSSRWMQKTDSYMSCRVWIFGISPTFKFTFLNILPSSLGHPTTRHKKAGG